MKIKRKNSTFRFQENVFAHRCVDIHSFTYNGKQFPSIVWPEPRWQTEKGNHKTTTSKCSLAASGGYNKVDGGVQREENVFPVDIFIAHFAIHTKWTCLILRTPSFPSALIQLAKRMQVELKIEFNWKFHWQRCMPCGNSGVLLWRNTLPVSFLCVYLITQHHRKRS